MRPERSGENIPSELGKRRRDSGRGLPCVSTLVFDFRHHSTGVGVLRERGLEVPEVVSTILSLLPLSCTLMWRG